MIQYRALTTAEIEELTQRACVAEDWEKISVSDSFTPAQLWSSRLFGSVTIANGARVFNSTVANYSIGDSALIDSVGRLECTGLSSFGNGVEVASVNENGGRAIKIFDSLTAQVAYIYTTYRHRHALIAKLDSMASAAAAANSSTIGSVGANAQIIGAKIIRNVNIAQGATIEGASHLSNGTLLAGGYIGADVKAHDFIAAEGSKIDNGSVVERCFVGENVIVSNGFTVVDSLLFASSHFENGEAVSIFAGPYTVSHHKSSLLIAGMFSFFNAGSGSNQSNHLFKCGPVHQGVHMRGCKFGSSAYVMLPAIDGAYTTVIGSHSSHHDTSDFPFSYLIVKDGRSTLMPANNLSSYGYARDIEKWKKRDKRKVKRDIISLDEYNPYITGALINAVNTANILKEKSPEAQNYVHNNVMIGASSLNRGLSLYNKAIAAALGAMLESNDRSLEGQGRSKWLDIAGQYITAEYLENILSDIEQGAIESTAQIDERLKGFEANYTAYAFDYAYALLSQLLAHTPSEEELQQTIAAAQNSNNELKAMAERDMQRDNSASMAISYGLDSDSKEDKIADFNAVRGL